MEIADTAARLRPGALLRVGTERATLAFLFRHQGVLYGVTAGHACKVQKAPVCLFHKKALVGEVHAARHRWPGLDVGVFTISTELSQLVSDPEPVVLYSPDRLGETINREFYSQTGMSADLESSVASVETTERGNAIVVQTPFTLNRGDSGSALFLSGAPHKGVCIGLVVWRDGHRMEALNPFLGLVDMNFEFNTNDSTVAL